VWRGEGFLENFYFVSVKMRRSNFHTPLLAYGWKVPPHNKQQQTTTNKQQKRMQKVQNVFPIYKLENNEKIRDLAEDRGQIYCRVAIMPTATEDTLTDAQKALLEKLSDKQKKTTLKGQLEREISNIFPIAIFSEYIDGLEEIAKNEDYFSEEGQNEIISQLSDLLKGEEFIFTYYTESIDVLLKGTEYNGTKVLYTENSDGEIKPVRSRNNLYFGFFESEEEAFAFIQSRLVADIEEEKLMLENPNKPDESGEETKTTEKPKLQLKRK